MYEKTVLQGIIRRTRRAQMDEEYRYMIWKKHCKR